MTTAQSDSPAAETLVPAPPRRVPGVLDMALRVAGGAVSAALAALTAVFEIFYAPLRVGGVLIGASVLVAAVVNYWLLRYTVSATGSGPAGLLPPAVWFALMLVASDRTTEGDTLMSTDNWVALVTIFVGSLSFAISGHRLLSSRSQPPVAGRSR